MKKAIAITGDTAAILSVSKFDKQCVLHIVTAAGGMPGNKSESVTLYGLDRVKELRDFLNEAIEEAEREFSRRDFLNYIDSPAAEKELRKWKESESHETA